jgi:hypothetical protein
MELSISALSMDEFNAPHSPLDVPFFPNTEMSPCSHRLAPVGRYSGVRLSASDERETALGRAVVGLLPPPLALPSLQTAHTHTPYHIPYHTIPYHTIPYHTIPIHATPFIYHTNPSQSIPCHAMPCHAMPCHAMPCHTIPLTLFHHAQLHLRRL